MLISRCFSFTVVLLFCYAFSFAQVQKIGSINTFSANEADLKTKFDPSRGVIDPTSKVGIPDRNKRPSNLKAVGGPGDTPVFLIHVNKSFARKGDIVEFNLVPMTQNDDTYWVYGRIFKPGAVGYYDGTERVGYFNADIAGYGDIRKPRVGDFHKVYTRMFNHEDSAGWFQIDFVIYDNNGNFIQQIWINIYLIETGPITSPYFLSNIKGRESNLLAYGNFPIGIPIYYMVGIPRHGYLITGPDPESAAYASDDGKTVELRSRILFSNKTSQDVMMWSPGDRQAICAPHAVIEEGSN